MIELKLKNDEYYIYFIGHKSKFSDYLNKIVSIENKRFDIIEKCWVFPKSSLAEIQRKFPSCAAPQEGSAKPIEPVKPKVQLVKKKNPQEIKHNLVINSSIGQKMKLKPYDYQKEAIQFGIDNINVLINYPCGSGKTPIGIGLYLEAIDKGVIKGPGLIVVKASLKTQWLMEVNKFSNLKANIIQTPSDLNDSIKDKLKRRKNKLKSNVLNTKKLSDENVKKLKQEIIDLEATSIEAFNNQFEGYDLLILNYETLRQEDVKKALHKKRFEFIFTDESQYFRNKDSKRSQALYEFNYAKMKIGATATPITKDPSDIFGLFKFIKPDLFKSWKEFSSLYIKYAGYGKIVGFKNLDKLRDKITPYIIIKNNEDIGDQLPDLTVMQRYCNLSTQQLEMTEKILLELEELKEEEFKIRSKITSQVQLMNNQELQKIEAKILALQTFAQEIADSVRLLEESDSEMAKNYICKGNNNKLELLAELVEEIIESEGKVAIFSRFAKMQPIIAERIQKIDKDIKIAYVRGEMSSDQRYDEVYNKFRDKDEYKVLILSDAGAEGLNLSKCQYLIEYDISQSYAIQTQRHGRIKRADSIYKNAFVYQLIANDSWDTIQQKIVEKKEGYDVDIIKYISNSKE